MGTTALGTSPVTVVWSGAGARCNVAIREGNGSERERERGGYLIDGERVWVREGPGSDGGHAPVTETKHGEAEWGRRGRSTQFVA